MLEKISGVHKHCRQWRLWTPTMDIRNKEKNSGKQEG